MEGLLLEDRLVVRRCDAGEIVFEEGDSGDAAYFIRAGSIDIVGRGSDGRERLLNHLRCGELFGEMALLDQTQRSASAIAGAGTELLVIPREEVSALLQRVPQLSLWMLKLFSHRLRVLTRMVAQMEEVHDVNLKILAGQEEERRRIGREIHDGVAQSFVGCITRAQYAERLLEQDPDQVRFQLDELEDDLRDGLEKMRELIYNLYPKELDRVGLVGAIKRFIERIAESNRLQVTFENQGLDTDLPAALEATLYCIVQEALNNVQRHAGASRARVELQSTGSRLSLLIADDGRGFDPEVVLASDAWRERYGLLSMEERAKLAGGRMELESRPGGGTRLRFSFPLPACARDATAGTEDETEPRSTTL